MSNKKDSHYMSMLEDDNIEAISEINKIIKRVNRDLIDLINKLEDLNKKENKEHGTFSASSKLDLVKNDYIEGRK